MALQFTLARDTAAAWAASSRILLRGEPGYDETNQILKVGDGATSWALLPSITIGPVGPKGSDGAKGLDGSNVLPTNTAIAQAVTTAGATKQALDKNYDLNGTGTNSLLTALPNLYTAIRTYNDASPATLRMIGLGSSVGLGPNGTPDAALSVPAYLFSKLSAAVNRLGNLVLGNTNGSVSGSIVTSANNMDYAAAKSTAGGKPIVVPLVYGMNDGQPAQYHSSQTYPGVYAQLKILLAQIAADGGDAVVFTTPHPHSTRNPWTSAVASPTYPSTTPVPALTQAASVVNVTTRSGAVVPASYRHLRVNEAMRQAAAEAGVLVLDVEKYWFDLIAAYGEDALYDTGNFNHPNVFAYTNSYLRAVDDFIASLTKPIALAATKPTKGSKVVLFKVGNSAYASTTTLASDAQLTAPVAAGKDYRVEVKVYYTGSTAADLRISLGLPANTTGSGGVSGVGNAATNLSSDGATFRRVQLPDTYGMAVGCNGADAVATYSAVIHVTTSGTVSAQFCQDVSNASATTVYADSYIVVEEITS